jgi:hypothetical protein
MEFKVKQKEMEKEEVRRGEVCRCGLTRGVRKWKEPRGSTCMLTLLSPDIQGVKGYLPGWEGGKAARRTGFKAKSRRSEKALRRQGENHSRRDPSHPTIIAILQQHHGSLASMKNMSNNSQKIDVARSPCP